MKRRVLWRSSARKEFVQHLQYLRENASNVVALEFHLELDRALSALTAFPYLGTARPLDDAEWSDARMWQMRKFPNHLIFYQPVPEGIMVLSIFHSSPDYYRILPRTPKS